MLNGASWKELARELYDEVTADNVFDGAAALGFYLMVAVFPALILTMSVLPYLPIDRVDQAIMDLIDQALPDDASAMVSGVVSDVTTNRRSGLLSFSALATLWAVSTGMFGVMRQLNRTYDVEESRGFVRGRATAIGLSALFGVLVIGALSLVVLGGVIQSWIGSRFGFSGGLLTFFAVLRWVIIVSALLLGFALIYRLAPNIDVKFKLISPGSVIGVVLLIAVSLGFGFYAQNFGNYNAMYGSIGAVVMLMIWLYMAGLVLLAGSEINALVERHQGRSAQMTREGASENDHDDDGERHPADDLPGHAPARPASTQPARA
jgi:membrane protein